MAGSDLFSRSLAPLLVVALLLSLAGSAAPNVARGQALGSGGVTSAAAPRTGPSPTALTAHAPIDVGADADFTAANGVVRGRGTAADPYVIAGWNITATDVDGVYIYGTTAHFVIRDLAITVTGFACSVSLETVQFGTLANATLMSETANVCVFDSSDVVIQGNALAGGGLLVDTCLRVTVTGNVLVDGDGVEVADSDTVTVAANRILGSGTFGVEATYSGNVTISGNVVEGRDFDGIAVDSVSNAAVSGNDVRGSGGAGIYVSGTDRSVVADNNVSGSWSGGIDLEYATNATVRNNRLTDDGLSVYGGVIEEYDTHAVTGNLVNGLPLVYDRGCSDVTLNGTPVGQVFFVNCRNIRASNLTIERTDDALVILYSTNVTVEGSAFSGDAGAVVVESSDTVRLVANTMTDNDLGASLEDTANATAFHNSFIRNRIQANDMGGLGHAWDDGYPSGGNYYSSYAGFDDCSGPAQDVCPDPDGIGDTPMPVGGGYADRYPLLYPFGRPGQPPNASFAYSPVPVLVNATILFDASASADPDGSIASYAWDFGDATTAQGPSPLTSKAYGARGTYIVNLTVRDNSRLFGNTSRTVRAYAAPVASFTWSPPSPLLGQTVTFNASASYGVEGTIVAYAWDFGDGTRGAGVSATHVYTNRSGVVTITLSVTDDLGLVGSKAAPLTLPDDPWFPASVAAYAGARGENGWFTSNVTATLNATDQGSGVASIMYRINGVTWEVYGAPLQFTEGEASFEYYATDFADNEEVIHEDSVNVDSVPPTILDLQPTGLIPTSPVTISWDATDNTSGIGRYEVSVDGAALQPMGTNRTTQVALAPGSHRVLLHALDVAGNVAIREAQFEVQASGVGGLVLWILGLGVVGAVVVVALAVMWRRRTRRRGAPPEPSSPPGRGDKA